MLEGFLLMSADERERSHLIRETVEKKLRQREAAERLRVSIRQFKRLARAWKQNGDAGLVSRQRGQPSNHRLSVIAVQQIEQHLRETYPDFGPTLAAEKLAERNGIVVSRETLRHIQIRLGLHKPKRRRQKRIFQSRTRRPRFGDLVQIDGSPHEWLEGRGPRCTLIVFIDDATSRLLGLRFVQPKRRRLITRPCGPVFWNTGVRWRSTRTATASSGSTPRMRKAATARPSSAGWLSDWVSN